MYILAYDIGTTGIKTNLYRFGKTPSQVPHAVPQEMLPVAKHAPEPAGLTLVASAMAEYELYMLDNGGVEQQPEDWWQGMVTTTRSVLAESGIDPTLVQGISFCSQMQGLVLVDSTGRAVRPAMSYMDQRAKSEKVASVGHGVQIQGINMRKLLRSLRINGAAPASVKDPLWKYLWVKRHEPENFAQVHKWLDVKEYLIARCTGRFVMTPDSAFATFLYDSRPSKGCWSQSLCNMYGVPLAHLSEIVGATESVGGLLPPVAEELGLSASCQVFGGGGDASLIGVGAGAVAVGDTHIYSGTSGWVSTVVDKRTMDLRHMLASVVGVKQGNFNYFGELETSGKCLEWVRDHLALDEIDMYLQKLKVTESPEAVTLSLYDHMCQSIAETPAGSGGVIFTPWLHGNRCPFEDPNVRGMFFNISLDTGKRKLIRAVLEGIAYHTRWMLEASETKVPASQVIRFVGGGALSPLTCQIMADITGRTIETVDHPQNVGALGAAVCCGIGLGTIADFSAVKRWVPAVAIYTQNPAVAEVYNRGFSAFKQLYSQNKKLFRRLNG